MVGATKKRKRKKKEITISILLFHAEWELRFTSFSGTNLVVMRSEVQNYRRLDLSLALLAFIANISFVGHQNIHPTGSKMSSSNPIWLLYPLLEENFISREAFAPS